MTREDAFIADIIANPADDAVRLIYADWLDGQGREEYGEFIRVQCELARRFPAPVIDHQCAERKSRRLEYTTEGKTLVIGLAARGNCKRCDWLWDCEALRGREWELLEQHRFSDWVEPLRVATDRTFSNLYCLWNQGGQAINLQWSRGFVAEVRLSCQDWITHGPALVRRHPIERVVLVDRKPQAPGVHSIHYLWGWVEDHRFAVYQQRYRDVLPQSIWANLNRPKTYPTESAALDALSAAALLYARQTEPAMVSA